MEQFKTATNYGSNGDILLQSRKNYVEITVDKESICYQ